VGFIIEEKFMRNHKNLDPIMIVGAEGSFATAIWIVALVLFQFIPCSSQSYCTNGHVEDSFGAIEDYRSNPNLIY
jgi:hypothetical protein